MAAVASYAPSQAVTDHVEQRRVKFGFEVAFSNGDVFEGRDCRPDMEDEDVSDEALIEHIVRDPLQLLVGSAVAGNEDHPRTAQARVVNGLRDA